MFFFFCVIIFLGRLIFFTKAIFFSRIFMVKVARGQKFVYIRHYSFPGPQNGCEHFLLIILHGFGLFRLQIDHYWCFLVEELWDFCQKYPNFEKNQKWQKQ